MSSQQNSLKIPEDNPEMIYASQETVPADVDTRIPRLQERFYFHELIRDSNTRKHYIVEDIEVDPSTLDDPDAPLFYYLKQEIFSEKHKYQNAVEYYRKLLAYCKSTFAKTDIAKLNYVFDFDDNEEGYYEVVVIFEYGESDRIDIESISNNHINKFLKNVCLLLSELKSYDKIYHNNIFLKNIVLVDGELRLSGFRPFHRGGFSAEDDWKVELAKEHSPFRLDLYLLGLLWLTFLNIKLNDVIPKDLDLFLVHKRIKKVVSDLPENKRTGIITRLVDLENHSKLTLEEIILDFDEYYILENIRIEESQERRDTGHSYNSGPDKYKMSNDNLFDKPYRDSDSKFQQSQVDEKATARMFNSIEKDNVIKIDGVDFTLRDKNSVDEEEVNKGEGKNSFFDINNQSLDGDRKVTDPTYIHDKNRDEKESRHRSLQFKERMVENSLTVDKDKIRKMKSNAEFLSAEKETKELDKKLDSIKEKKNSEHEHKSETDKSHPNYSYQNNILSENKSKDDSFNLVRNLEKKEGIKENSIDFDKLKPETSLLSKKSEEKKSESLKQDQPRKLSHFGNEESEVINQKRISSENRKTFEQSKEDGFLKEDEIEEDEEFNLEDDLNSDDLKSDKEDDDDIEDLSKTIEDDIIRSSVSRKKRQTKEDKPIPFEFVEDNEFEYPEYKVLKPVEKKPVKKKKDKPKKKKRRQFERTVSPNKNGYINEWDEELIREREAEERSKLVAQEMKVYEKQIRKEQREKSRRKMERIYQLEEERKHDEKFLRLKIDRVLREKLEEKERKKKDDLKRLRREKSDRSLEPMGRGLKKTKNTSSAYLKSPRSRMKSPRSNISNLNRSFSDIRSVITKSDNLTSTNKNMAKKVKMSSTYDRNKMFTYNNQLENKNVPFKRLLEKPEEYVNKGNTSRSKSRPKMNKERSKSKPKLDKEKSRSKPKLKRLKKKNKIKPKNRDESDSDSYDNFPGFETHREQIDKSKDIVKMVKEKQKKNKMKKKEKEYKPELSKISEREQKGDRLMRNNKESGNILVKDLAEHKEEKYVFQEKFTPIVERKQEASFEEKRSIEKKRSVEKKKSTDKKRSTDKKKSVERKVENTPEQIIIDSKQNSFSNSVIRSKVKNTYKEKYQKGKPIQKEIRTPPRKNSTADFDQKISKFENKMKELNLDPQAIERSPGMGMKSRLSNNINGYELIERSKIVFIKANEIKVNYEYELRRSLDRKSHSSNKPGYNSNEIQRQISNKRSSVGYIDSEFQDIMDNIKKLIAKKKYKKAAQELELLLNETNDPDQKAEVYKVLADLYLRQKNYPKAILYGKKYVRFLEKNADLEGRKKKLQEALISLAIAQIKAKQTSEALETLEHPVFKNKEECPFEYFGILGDAYCDLGLYDDAYQAYMGQFNLYILREMTDYNLELFYLLVNKIMIVLNLCKDNEEMINFYKELLIVVDRIVRVNGSYHSLVKSDNIIKETVLSNILGILFHKENRTIASFILSDLINNGIVEYYKLDDEHKQKFVGFYMSFADHLKKKENFGGYKQIYINYMEESFRVLQDCEENETIFKKRLSIKFNLGLFYLKENDYEMAKDCFEASLKLYESLKIQPNDEIFDILYNIAVSLYNLKEYHNCPYYFEKIRELGCKNTVIINKSIKMLSKTYFRLGEFENLHKTLSKWIYLNVNDENKDARNFDFYVSLFFIACEMIHSTEFKHVLDKMREKIDTESDYKVIHYFNLFYSLANLSFRNKNYEKNKEILNNLESLLGQRIDEKFAKQYFVILNEIYTKYVLDKKEGSIPIEKNLIKSLNDNRLSMEQNAKNIEFFLQNLLFISINKIPVDPHLKRDFSFRNRLMNKIRKIKDSQIIFKYVLSLFKKMEKVKKIVSYSVRNVSPGIKEHKPDTFKMTASERKLGATMKSSQPIKSLNRSNKLAKRTDRNPNAPKRKLFSKQQEIYNDLIRDKRKEEEEVRVNLSMKSSGKKGKRLKSQDLLAKSNLKRKAKCLCFEPDKKKYEIVGYIEEFLRAIKNMFFLDVTKKIEEYYQSFEDIIKEKRLNWEKFVYIKKLFRFYFKYNKEEEFQNEKFEKLLNEVVDNPKLCIHDFKMMIVLMESFKDSAYMEAFVVHMDRNHKHLSAVIFRELFHNNFQEKYKKIKDGLFLKIQNEKYYVLENYPFIHYLNEENNLIVEKEFKFKVYKRLRYVVMNDRRFHRLFLKYIDFKDLICFYLRYNSYRALVKSIKKEIDAHELITEFKEDLNTVMNIEGAEVEYCEHFLFDFLLLMNLFKFNHDDNEKIGEIVIGILKTVIDKLNVTSSYHVSVIASLIGNILYKNKLYASSLEAKKLAFHEIKHVKNGEIVFPSFFKEIKPANLVFNILVFMFMNNMILGEKEMSMKVLEKLDNFELQSKKNKIEQRCVTVLNLIVDNKLKQASVVIEETREIIRESKVSSISKDMYNATIEKMALDVEVMLGDGDRIERQRNRSRGSISRLYNNLINK